MNWKEITVSAVLGLIGAASADLSSYRKTLQSDPDAKFDWKLAAWRWVQGAATTAFLGGGTTYAGN